MNTLTSNELNALIIADREASRIAQTIKNIERRAEVLFTEAGYTMELFATGLYEVSGPAGQYYLVTCDTICGEHCTCPSFDSLKTCKHLLAVKARLDEEAMCEAHDALYADSDDDAYPEF